jgi:hypothetical protein
MENIKNFLLEKLTINKNFNPEPEFNGHTLSNIAELIYDLFDNDDFSAGPSSGRHCTGFDAIRNFGLYDTIEYHCMTEDIEGIILDDNSSDSDAFWDFFIENEDELTELILQYE